MISWPSKQGENHRQKRRGITLSSQVFILMINGTAFKQCENSWLQWRKWKLWSFWHSWPFPRRTLRCLKGPRPFAYFPHLASSKGIWMDSRCAGRVDFPRMSSQKKSRYCSSRASENKGTGIQKDAFLHASDFKDRLIRAGSWLVCQDIVYIHLEEVFHLLEINR